MFFMKTNGIILLSILSLSISSCNKIEIADEFQPGTDNGQNAEEKLIEVGYEAISPTCESNSRTSLEEGNKVYWNKGDEIILMGNSGGYGYRMWTTLSSNIQGEKSQTAWFSGYVYDGAIDYFAFYPENILRGMNDYGQYLRIPTRQKAVAGSFDQNLNPAWAYTDKVEGSLQFHNLSSLLKFTISDGAENIKSVTLAANNMESVLSGDYFVNLSNKDNIRLQASTEEGDMLMNSVVLDGTFESGKSYYFVLGANGEELNDGFTLTFENKEGKKYVKSAKAGIIKKLESGRIANVGEINLAKAEFTDNSIVDKAFILAVEESCDGNINWVKNEDGTVPLTPENLDIIRSVTSLGLSAKKLTSVHDIKYFTGLVTLDISYNFLKEANLNDLVNLKSLYARNSELRSLQIDKLTNLTGLYCANNYLTELNIGGLTQLVQLQCRYNELSKLDIGNLINLKMLYCDQNHFKSLDLENLTKLEFLSCCNNNITEIDVSNKFYLTTFSCDFNSITSLDLSNNINLTSLGCTNNKISVLDLKFNPNLRYFYCYDQNIGEGNKLQLYITSTLKPVWDNVASLHNETVEVHIEQ